MEEKDFLDELVDMMDTEMELTMDTRLADVEEWDSLSHVAFMAFVATKGLGKVTPQDVKAAETVRDLYAMMSGEAE